MEDTKGSWRVIGRDGKVVRFPDRTAAMAWSRRHGGEVKAPNSPQSAPSRTKPDTELLGDKIEFPKNPKPNEEFRQRIGKVTLVWKYNNGNWSQVRTEVEKTDFEKRWAEIDRISLGTNARKLTGHDEMPDPSMRPDRGIQAMKDKVFGSRTGQSEMFWLHLTKGLIVLPAVGDTTHRMVEENPSKYTNDASTISALQDKPSILAFGRVEHREWKGWKGWVHLLMKQNERPSRSTIRTLERRYPNHAITDGYGRQIMGEGRQLMPFRSWIGVGV